MPPVEVPDAPRPNSGLVDFGDPGVAPEPFLQMTPGEVQRLVTPPKAPQRPDGSSGGGERGSTYRGFQVIYEEPVQDDEDDERWTNTLRNWQPPPTEEEKKKQAVREGETTGTGGMGWAARESWNFLMQILTSMLKVIGNPVGFALPAVLGIGFLLVVGLVAQALRGAADLEHMRGQYEASFQSFTRAVDENEELPVELIEQGANEELLSAAVRRYELAQTQEDKLEAAQSLAAVMAAEYAVLETRGELELEVRRDMKRRVVSIQSKRRTVDDRADNWREAASTGKGKLAIALGRSSTPPLDD